MDERGLSGSNLGVQKQCSNPVLIYCTVLSISIRLVHQQVRNIQLNSETLVQFKKESETLKENFKNPGLPRIYLRTTKGMYFKSLGLYNEGLEAPTYAWGYVKLA